ncbi:MAG TPA: NAD-dependent epimerase/dehydratase family protein [Nitrososphaeraceae archaeon]|nr:NAD-dependent epimerase/dehydratase family protein [Nitrososphaeraceae archaeon]
MAKILVTGGAGFIGSSLTKALLSKGNDIIVYDNLSTGKKENLDFANNSGKLSFVNKDMLDIGSLEEVVNDCEKVYHLSANAFVNLGFFNTKIDYEQTILSTYNLLECMRKSKGCKSLYFTSTSAVYGEQDINVKASETIAPKPISLYGSAKLAAEALISGYCYTFDIQSLIFRLANIIGSDSTHGVIFDFLNKLTANSNMLQILGSGNQMRSYVHVDDCVNALTKFERLDKPMNIFNISSEDCITVNKIANLIFDEIGLKETKIGYQTEFGDKGWKGDVVEIFLDNTKLKDTGWSLKYNSEEAVIRTIKDYLASKFRNLV